MMIFPGLSGVFQSMSNQDAYGDAGPSRSTDHQSALADSGAATAMWFGTRSTTRPRPALRHAVTSRRNPAGPPSSALIWSWFTTS